VSAEVTPVIDAFMRETRVAVISTVDGRGHPRSAPVWFLWDGTAPVLFTSRTSLKWRNLEAQPYASLCVDERDESYESVIIDGRVEEVADRDLFDDVLAMSLAYWGEERGRAFAEGYRGERPDIAHFRIVPGRIVYQRSSE
jgi:PPOX class probable F420-dependent enzyme